MPRTFSVQPAKSNRSKCKACDSKIDKDELRMGTHTEATDEYSAQSKWFHLKCFVKKIRKGPSSNKAVGGFNELSASQQKKVMRIVFGECDENSSASESGSESSDDDRQQSKKKKRGKKRKLSASDSDNSVSDEEPPKKRLKLSVSGIDDMKLSELRAKCKEYGLKQSGKKSEVIERIKEFVRCESAKRKKAEHNKNDKGFQEKCKKEKEMYAEIMEELRKSTVTAMKKMLTHNGMVKTGDKQEVMERVADCKLYGVPPLCPECGGARLKVKYAPKYGHDGQGEWSCKGFWDDDHFHHCAYKTNEEMDRTKWVE